MTKDKPETGVQPGSGGLEAPPLSQQDVRMLRASQAKSSPHLGVMELAQADVPAQTDGSAGNLSADKEAQIAKLQEIYNKAIKDPNREQIFHNRMESIAKYDPKTFDDVVKIGDEIATKQLSPEAAGQEIARALRDTLNRHGPSDKLNLGTDQVVAVLGGFSGLMLAERANFDPSKVNELTGKMVDAAETELRLHKGFDGITLDPRNNNPIPDMVVHGVMWADNGEPALCVYNHGIRDRHKFAVGN